MTEDPLDELRASLPKGFEIDSLLDGGGQGTVFRGRYEGAPSALKIFDPNATDPERVRREVEFLSRADHPNLVRLHAVAPIEFRGVQHDLVAYEFHEGGNLLQWTTAESPPISEGAALDVGNQIGSAIEYLWSARIVHRDVKPANIVIDNDGRCVLVDIGFARHLDMKTMTVLGGSPGTPGYKSPEQAMGRRSLTIHSDVFSLGVTLYEVLTKVHPFGRDQRRIGSVEPDSMQTIRGDIKAGLSGLIIHMMSKRPGERPHNIVERFDSLKEG